MTLPAHPLPPYELAHRYDVPPPPSPEGPRPRVFMTGTQALARILFDQARRDRLAGLHTGGYVSGYRGSPLGGLDKELWSESARLEGAGIVFQPAVNEDLAATAVLGSQQVETDPRRNVDGVFAMWYGKGPGVDRSGDALKHGNAYGSSPHGGVLVVAGDDHGCVSSSMPHQSDVAFMSWFMPTLNPASVGEYLAYGEWGYALSRFSGMWVGFKAISETVEAAASVELRADRVFETPDFEAPATGLHYRWPDLPGPQIEERMEAKKAAVLAFAEANPLDRAVYGIEDARFGFVSTGKGHGDLMEALRLLGLDEAACRRLGIDVYKVAMVWPLAHPAALAFVEGLREVMVVEEKRGIIESQLKEHFYDHPGRKPRRMVGKRDEKGERLVPWTGELSPRLLVPLVARRLAGIFPDEGLVERAERIVAEPAPVLNVSGATRTPYFCSGCPHNTSTRVPEGSEALAGIGCHFMASWMDRDTSSLIQMGGEGVNWAALSRFTAHEDGTRRHVFQNLGEGTWYHSGSMAVRQAIAAGANITYKVLYNDAVAMTGGQPVDGPVSVGAIAHSSRAEGVERIALVSDDPAKFDSRDLPAGTTLHHRREMDAVQRELREVPGVSVLIYEQMCATEKRRRIKRGRLPDPRIAVEINELVCEGCGDCSVASNCLSVEPVETQWGRKRRINQSTCNTDLSCLEGFCPSFVTVRGAKRKREGGAGLDAAALAEGLPEPDLPALAAPYDLLVTGVGGTGVVTVGQLITMAAHLEGRGASVLDFTGFAQKFGSVLSYIRLAERPDAIHPVRIDRRSADAVIGCDAVVSSAPKASETYSERTRFVLNRAPMPTGDLVQRRDADLRIADREGLIRQTVGTVAAFDANALSQRLMGDTVFANVMLLGFAWQHGLVPVSLEALMRAVELNGVAVERNRAAFAFGRVEAERPERLAQSASEPAPKRTETVDEEIERRAEFLAGYQDVSLADAYRARMERFRKATEAHGSDRLTLAAARALFRVTAAKDEYEVARLHTDTGFLEGLQDRYEGDYRIAYHMAPAFLAKGRDSRGRPGKRRMGPWLTPVLRGLAKARRLRGTWADPFRFGAEAKLTRALRAHVEARMAACEADGGRTDEWTAALEAVGEVRGYGPVREAVARKLLGAA